HVTGVQRVLFRSRILGHAKELSGLTPRSLELQPVGKVDANGESQQRQQPSVERPRVRHVANPEIHVIKDAHQSSKPKNNDLSLNFRRRSATSPAAKSPNSSQPE